MKKALLSLGVSLVALFAFTGQRSEAANITFEVDTSKTWVGYMNVFANNSGSKGGYIFGSGWGLSDLQTIVTTSFKLQPNFNTYRDNVNGAQPDKAFWTDSTDGGITAGLNGNKFMEANTFVEPGVLAGSNHNLTFLGQLDSYSLASGYKAYAFIKGLNPANGYAADVSAMRDLSTVTPGTIFDVQVNSGSNSALIWQYGFMVTGLNANPTNEATLGNVTLSIPEPSSSMLMGFGLAGLLAFRLRRKA